MKHSLFIWTRIPFCFFLYLVLILTIYTLLSKPRRWLWVFPKRPLEPNEYCQIFRPRPLILKNNLDGGMLKGSSEGEGKEPGSLDIFDLVDGVKVESSLFFRLAPGEEEDAGEGRHHCAGEGETSAVTHFLGSALDGVADSLHDLKLNGRTMLGLNNIPSMNTLLSFRNLNRLAITFSVISWVTSMLWEPSERISASTMGTSPLNWQTAAYRARIQVFSKRASCEGEYSSILKTHLHFANLKPEISPSYP